MRPPSRSRRWISLPPDLAPGSGSGGQSSSARCAWGCSGGGLQWAALGSWPNFRHEGRPRQMLYAGLDIHKAVFQAAVLDPDSGELSESRFEPSRERLTDWAMQWQGKLAAVAIEATTGWRWVARELQAHGFEVRLVDPGRASALRGRRRQPKTDRLDARWLALLLARELLSECEAWLPPAEIQRLRDRTRLRKALAGDRTGWAQRLHALLAHKGWPCSRGRLLTGEGPPLGRRARARSARAGADRR